MRASCRGRATACAPILLLDEIAAHLDAARRAALFDEILALGAQAWMTGTDLSLFDGAAAQGANCSRSRIRSRDLHPNSD